MSERRAWIVSGLGWCVLIAITVALLVEKLGWIPQSPGRRLLAFRAHHELGARLALGIFGSTFLQAQRGVALAFLQSLAD